MPPNPRPPPGTRGLAAAAILWRGSHAVNDTPPTPSPDAIPAVEVVNEWLELRPSGIHGRGAFARQPIPAETRLLEYVGRKVDKTESAKLCDDGNPYIFTINDEWDIDGDVPWNPARFLNHSCGPNCEAQQEEDRIWIVALRDIATGEELTFNYGYDISEWRDYPCACGSPQCLGFIVAEEFHDQVRATLASESSRSPSQEPNPDSR